MTSTYDGLALQPLYVEGDGPGLDASGRPGAAPFVRGRTPTGSAGGWDVRQYHRGDDLVALNRRILDDLERGVTSIVVGPSGITTVDQLDDALRDVLLEVAPVALDLGPDTITGAKLLVEVLERRSTPAATVRAELGIDPLGTLARYGWLARSVADELAEAAAFAATTVARWPAVRTMRVDASLYRDAGASDAEEIATALATGVAYLRALEAAGVPLDTALGQLTFRFTADADQFATIAKLRAARRCWARVAEASGAAEHGGMAIHAVTACAMYTERDPWVNLLRATLACFAAAAAGADAITVLPFGAAAGHWDELGVRLARNTQIILAEESGMDRVADPAGGSWYVEQRSAELAAEAWRRFQEIEAAGGMAAELVAGRLGSAIDATWQARLANLARRKDAITGVSEFPNLDEQPLASIGSLAVDTAAPADAAVRIEPMPLRRLAAPFEALRDAADERAATGAGRPTVFLANLGPIATHTARATFAKNFFEVAGIRAVGDGGFDDAAAATEAFAASGASAAVICSSDARYAEHAAATAAALKAAGCATVYLAGNPGDQRDAYQAAGIDEFVYVGCDLLDVLGGALGR